MILFIVSYMLFEVLDINRRYRSINNQIKTISDQIKTIHSNVTEQQTLDALAPFFKVYSAYDMDEPLKFVRLGRSNDGGYVVPKKALEMSDALIGYGIEDDASFEEDFSINYKKPSYGFDCGIRDFKSTRSELFTFIPECIANDNFVYQGQKSSGKISSFNQHINILNLHNKKVFIKMDIEGAEYDAMDDILSNSNNITGIVVEIHFWKFGDALKVFNLFNKLSKDFILVHLHGNNASSDFFSAKNVIGPIPKLLELTYINKSIVTKYEVSKHQKRPLPIDMPNWPTHKDVEFEVLVD
jgi:hypothetical protein